MNKSVLLVHTFCHCLLWQRPFVFTTPPTPCVLQGEHLDIIYLINIFILFLFSLVSSVVESVCVLFPYYWVSVLYIAALFIIGLCYISLLFTQCCCCSSIFIFCCCFFWIFVLFFLFSFCLIYQLVVYHSRVQREL